MSDHRRTPTAFRLDEDKATETPRRAGGRKPSAMAPPRITIEPDEIPEPLVAGGPEPAQMERALRWGSLLASALFGLVALWAGLATTRLIEDLFARSPLLGWIGAGLMALAGLAAAMFIIREIVGLMRLSRLGTVREDAAQALVKADADAARTTIAALKRIYRGRRDVAWALDRLKEHEADVIDPADRVRVAEIDLIAPLDEAAGRLIGVRSRRVMLLTAITPAAVLDILFVAVQNLKMLREIATLYGGRPGLVGTMRLARMVIAHLAAAGALAMSDQLVQQVVGQGILGRLSARFGEGAVNGILTARIGLAAIDVCRPLPFTAASRPGLAQFLTEVMRMGEADAAAAKRKPPGRAP
jgi:putative membrane protein